MTNRIAIFRALQLGDMLCAVPALRALRAAHPGAKLDLIGLPGMEPFARRFVHYVDRFVRFPGFPGLPEREPDVLKIPEFLAAVQAENYDLAVQMQGSGRVSNHLIALFNAKITAGLASADSYVPAGGLFEQEVLGEHEVERCLRALKGLSIAEAGKDMEFPLTEADFGEFTALGARSKSLNNYVCLHPGSRDLRRRWPVSLFSAIGRALQKSGLQVAVTGVGEEESLCRDLTQRIGSSAVNLAGRTTLGSLAFLLKGSRLLVCNDTSVSHMAAALNVPSVVVFTVTDPDRWAPLDHTRHRPVLASNPAILETVLSEAESLLRGEELYAA